MTLHEALAQILRENGNAPTAARALADAVNDRGLYRTRDGSPVEVNQIHARTKNYQDLSRTPPLPGLQVRSRADTVAGRYARHEESREISQWVREIACHSLTLCMTGKNRP
jgi:hypothetical protein